MNYKYITVLISLTIISFGSCKESKTDDDSLVIDKDLVADSMPAKTTDITVISDYDMSKVDADNVEEFKENLVKIEKEFGEQWDFCTCAVKGDSINEAFKKPDLPDVEFNALFERLDFIDEKCKAFRIQNPSITPEERAAHEKEVKKCLKEAGL